MSSLFKIFSSLCLFTLCYACEEAAADQQSESADMDTVVLAANTPVHAPIKDSTITLDYLRGHFNPATHESFTAVDAKYTDGDGTYYLRKEAVTAFEEMHKAAAAENVQLTIISATRNFDRQKAIWESKWTGARLIEGNKKAPEAYPDPVERAYTILQWSSMPGTSRHHWGTDMDFNDLNNAYFENGEGLKVYEWLTENAATFGFCQPYSSKGDERPHGYNEEKWHWSYEPLARQLTDLAGSTLTNEAIEGFKGSEVAPQIDVVKKYILGVNSACLE